MREYFTEALVLDKEELGERDFKVHLYTYELGKVAAKVKSSRNILSKLNSHLEPFSLTDVRILQTSAGGNLQVVDALLIEKLKPSWPLRKFFYFIKNITLEHQPDDNLWFLLKEMTVSGKLDYKKFLALQGFDPRHALCQTCQQPQPEYFLYENQGFLCKDCASNQQLGIYVA